MPFDNANVAVESPTERITNSFMLCPVKVTLPFM